MTVWVVYAFSSTPLADLLDGYGSNIYLVSFDSAYRKVWYRENSFIYLIA